MCNYVCVDAKTNYMKSKGSDVMWKSHASKQNKLHKDWSYVQLCLCRCKNQLYEKQLKAVMQCEKVTQANKTNYTRIGQWPGRIHCNQQETRQP
jgi:hypothetical protein